MSRPKKKPEYDKTQIMNSLLQAICECYSATDDSSVSLRQVAAEFDMSHLKARKLLITAGAFHSDISDEVNNLAAYLSAQPRKHGAAKNKDTVELGKKIYRAGIAERNIPACAGCHGPNGAGLPSQFPRIGGQHQEYTAAQLTNFRTGVRKNSTQMTAIAKRLYDEEIQAVADYVAGMK